jgi:hypothetical protein
MAITGIVCAIPWILVWFIALGMTITLPGFE